MKFTEEQFKDLEDESLFCCDDIKLDWNDRLIRYNVFNSLPREIQGLAVQWGVSDTVFRDEVFEHLVKTLYTCDTKKYYQNWDTLFTDEYQIQNTNRFKTID